MTGQCLPTKFAPAERLSGEDVTQQTCCLKELPFLNRVSDAVPNVMVVLNKHRQIVYANKALLSLVGAEDEDAIYGLRPGEVLDCVHASETDGGCGTTEFCSTCGAVNAILTAFKGSEDIQECRIVRKDGEAIDLRVWTKPIRELDEEFIFFYVVDISDEKRRRILERIFFHDVLNTAGGVFGLSQVLMDDIGEQKDEFIGMIYNSSRRLIEEIKAQRELLAAESGELQIHPDRIGSKAILESVRGTYEQHHVSKGREIQIDPETEDVEIETDITLLTRVLGNLLKNALEAITRGGAVTLGCRRAGDRVQFWVHNDSCMPRDVQLQLFQRSFSTKSADRGLGTYSVKLLTDRYLGGTVSFTSSEGDGTVFRAEYPLTPQVKTAEGS